MGRCQGQQNPVARTTCGVGQRLQGSPCPAPSQRELSLEGICICLLFFGSDYKTVNNQKVSVLKIRDHLFLILFPLSFSDFFSSLSPTLRTQSSAGSIVTSFWLSYLMRMSGLLLGLNERIPCSHSKQGVLDCSIKNICFSWKWFSI